MNSGAGRDPNEATNLVPSPSRRRICASVASGSEIVAGGSIHIYGTLRGRAMAGVNGNPAARIYCQKIEAELLAIDGYYRTAEEIDARLCDRPTQVWLEGDIVHITPLN